MTLNILEFFAMFENNRKNYEIFLNIWKKSIFLHSLLQNLLKIWKYFRTLSNMQKTFRIFKALLNVSKRSEIIQNPRKLEDIIIIILLYDFKHSKRRKFGMLRNFPQFYEIF